MSQQIKIAAVQMDANPAPTVERLARAERLVTQAAEAGAELIVLPELFNTGYGYDDENHRRAEALDGPTATWLRETAARLDIHLAGSLMLIERPEVYNALLLLAPDGRTWRYDKNYPWGWERGYFRERRGISVADTDLGRLGMMICADVGHRGLWKQYAGKVDLMLICSCPPDVGRAVFCFPDGQRVPLEHMGPLMASTKDAARLMFGAMLNQQTAWLGVPAVNTVGAGRISTAVPHARLLLLALSALAPGLARLVPQAGQAQMACEMTQGCKVLDARGQVLAQLTQEQGEAFTLAEVTLAEQRPQPRGAQPPAPLAPLVYLISDFILPWLSIPTYRRGLRRAWGQDMAPLRVSARQWAALLGASTVAGWLVGSLFKPRQKR
jgi:predicted amidohydrolase